MSEEDDFLKRAEGQRGPASLLATATSAKRDVKVHYDVFSLFRPWQACRRCQENLDPDRSVDATALPDVGDLVCPHTRRAEYVKLVNAIRQGKNLNRLSHETWTSQATGERFAEVLWEEYAVKTAAPALLKKKEEPEADPEL